ncbi:MAG: glycosyltransferase family 9 protein [Candidatus Omnitrophota bacterium]|nr:glycosyltransferase family 9 protein [Candidatus Omnitrophota bacterium]
MNTQKMRMIDQYAGRPACFILAQLDRIIKFFVKVKTHPKEILTMKYFGMGSILLSTPMFRALRETFPDAKITFVTFHNNREICERLGFADRYLYIRSGSFSIFIADLIKLLFEFRRHHFDIAIDMEFFSRFSSIVTYLSFASQRIGFYLKNEYRASLYTNPIFFNYYKHAKDIFLALAHEAGADTKDKNLPKIKIYNVEKDFISQVIRDHKIENAKKIVINVNVGNMCLERRWPKDYYVSLLNNLARYPDLFFIFIGSDFDRAYVQSVIDSLEKKDRIINLAGRTNLGQVLTLLEISDLFITSDSGPLHIAELTKVKTISFFGPETPNLYGPSGNNHLVFYKGLYCSPCLNVYNVKTAMHGNKRCFEGNNKCMYEIGVEEVLGKVKQLLGINND